MKVVMLATGLTGYLDAKFRALVDRGVELFIITRQYRENVAFETLPITHKARVHAWIDEPTGSELNAMVDEFAPDAILAHSWHVEPYRAVLKGRSGECVRVLWMDNNWRGTPKQWMGRATSRWYIHPLFDAVMVPCDRTEAFARHLGFGGEDIFRGSLSADTDLYGAEPWSGAELSDRARFLAALRMVHHKGADVLADAYLRYRGLVDRPWTLDLAGTGPLLERFEGMEGVTCHGFVQPSALAELMHRSSAYVNPSRAEPYGVVLHEAASASLPIVTSDGVGAAPTMVQDGYNGWLFPTGRPELLAERMARLSSLPADRLAEQSLASHHISKRLSPSGWARNLDDFLTPRINAVA